MELALSLVIAFLLFLLSCIFCIHQYKRSNQCETLNYRHIVSAPSEYDQQYEVVVIGSGILGSAIAAVLSQDGRRVVVIERDLSEPDRIVGELLQPGGYIALTKLGLKDAVERIDAHTVHGYVIHDLHTKSSVTLSYPLDKNNAIMTGRSFHHGRFVMGLRNQARKYGATLVEGTATSLLEDNDGNIIGVSYKDKESSSIKVVMSDLTIVADGCFSRFRKDLSSKPVTVSSHFAGVVMHDCQQHLSGHAEIVLTSCGPVLVYQISSTATRILIDIPDKMPSNLDQFIKDEITPQLTDLMQKPFQEALRSERIRTMPNSFLPPTPCFKSGVLLLGDAFNMRHPLTGAGMSVALNDVLIWRELLQSVTNFKDHKQIYLQHKKFIWKRRKAHSFVVNVLAQALYSLFAASDDNLMELRQACFEYFKLGGRAVTDPIGLLSVTRPHPVILIGHFFAVALYAVYRVITSCKIWQLHHGIYRSGTLFIKACSIIFPLIKSEILLF